MDGGNLHSRSSVPRTGAKRYGEVYFQVEDAGRIGHHSGRKRTQQNRLVFLTESYTIEYKYVAIYCQLRRHTDKFTAVKRICLGCNLPFYAVGNFEI